MLDSIRVLLGRIDREGAKYPEHLFDYDGHVPAVLTAQLSSVGVSIGKGIEFFVKNFVTRMVEGELSLLRAVGHTKVVVNSVRDDHLKALQDSVEVASLLVERTRADRRDIDTQRQTIERATKDLSELEAKASANVLAVEKIRTVAQKLASGDARTQLSLERLIKDSRSKYAEAADTVAKINSVFDTSKELSGQMEVQNAEMDAMLKRLSDIEVKADLVLRGATQAGLAGAYKIERDRLHREQLYFTCAFYIGIVAVVVYATIFIFPIFRQLVSSPSAQAISISDAAILVLARTVVIAPAIWALVFTNARHSKLEILQMDYAAKANTALAYSGYKDELSENKDLSDRLMGGLLVRFIEHPERLLKAGRVTEKVEAGPGGMTYTSQTSASDQGAAP